jgi:hypothetical protein
MNGDETMDEMKVIYVCSPLRGNVERNIRKAIGYSRFVYMKGGVPIAPHAYLTLFLDDNIKEEREAGLKMGLQLLKVCNELWAFGNKISEGMAMEIKAAKEMGIKVCRFDEAGEPLEVSA